MNENYIGGIYDKKANHFLGLQIYPDYQTAVRSWQMAIEKNEVFNKWPEDFELRIICQINLEDGQETTTTFQAIPAIAFVKKEKNDNKDNKSATRKN